MHPLQHSEASDIEKTEDIVRCHLLDLYHDELPYEWQVQTVGWTPYLDGTLRIDVDIYVHTEVHKGILIGRQSKCIKQLWLQAQTDLVKLYRRPIKLVLRGKLMKEFISKEVRRGTDLSELRNSRLHPESYSLPPRLQRLIAPKSQ
jgi:GTPase Era involved in 16S rRNA processing